VGGTKAAAASEKKEDEAAAASKDNTEEEIEKGEHREEKEDVQDAVSELNHCAQMNAWPVAIYRDISPPRPVPPPPCAYVDSSPAARVVDCYPGGTTAYGPQATGMSGPTLMPSDGNLPIAGASNDEHGYWNQNRIANGAPTFNEPLYSSEYGSGGLNGSVYTAISDGYDQGGQVYNGVYASFSGPSRLPGPDLPAGPPHWHAAAPLTVPPTPGVAVGQPPITGLSFVPQIMTGTSGSAKTNYSSHIPSSNSTTGSSGIIIGSTPASAGRVFSVEVSCDVRGQAFTAQGHAKSKKRAKQAAAKAMLNQLVSNMGPVVALPTSAVAGASLFAHYQALVAKFATTTTPRSIQDTDKSNKIDNKDNMNGSNLINESKYGSNFNIGFNGSSDDNNGHCTDNSRNQIHTTLEGDGALSYRRAKAASEQYQTVKQALHAFYGTSRSSGGMGQQWLSRRLPPSRVLGRCGCLSTDQMSTDAAIASTTPSNTVATVTQDATPEPPAPLPMPAGLSFKASAVDRDEDYYAK